MATPIVTGSAPTLEKTKTGAGGIYASEIQKTAGVKLRVIDGKVTQPEIDAVGKAREATIQAADVINESLGTVAEASGQTVDSLKRQSDAQVAGKIAEQQRLERLQQLNAEALRKHGVDFSQPADLLAAMAAEVANTSVQRQAIGDQIDANLALNPLDNPLDWLMAQFQTDGLVDQYNGLAVKQNSLQRESQATIQMAANYAEAKKTTEPVSSFEERNAALTDIREIANQKILRTTIDLANTRNQAAVNTAQLLQTDASLLRNLSAEQRQLEAQHIASWNEAKKWDADRFHREFIAAQSADAMITNLSLERAERAMGLNGGTLNAALKTMSKEEQVHIMRFAFSNELESPEQALTIARYANRAGAPAAMVEMADMMTDAKKSFDAAASSGQIKGVSIDSWKTMDAASKSTYAAKHIRDFTQQAVAQKVAQLTPQEFTTRYKVDVARLYPELTGYTDGSVPLLNTAQIADTFLAAAQGNTELAAARMADYNKLKLKIVSENSPLTQAGIKAPTAIVEKSVSLLPQGMQAISIQSVTGGALSDKLQVDWTSPASVENYLLMKKRAAALLPYYGAAQQQGAK